MSKLYIHENHPHQPQTVTMEDAREAHKARGGFNAALAVTITRGFGSVFAFYVLVAWMLGWMLLATTGVGPFGRDPYPFQFLLFLSNLVQLWALPVIMVGQNVLGKHQELVTEETAKNTRALLHQIMQIAKHLSAQDEQLLSQQAELLKQTKILIALQKKATGE